MIRIGTSGYQYPEWKGKFYPAGFSTGKMLPYYAEHFCTTEINYSFYRIPAEKSLTAWSAAVPDDFRFSFKAPKQISHVQALINVDETFQRFIAAIELMGGKLGAVLVQLPPYLRKDRPR